MNTCFLTGRPPVPVIADAAVRGSGPVESGHLAPTELSWRELAGARVPVGKLDAMRFLTLLPADAVRHRHRIGSGDRGREGPVRVPAGTVRHVSHPPGLPDIWTPSGDQFGREWP